MTEELRALLERIIKYCHNNGSEADRRIGLHEGTMTKWAGGQTLPTLKSLRRIADAFEGEPGLNITYRGLMLAGGYDTPDAPPDASERDPVPAYERAFWSRVDHENLDPEELETAHDMSRTVNETIWRYIRRRRDDLPRPRYEPPPDL